MTPEEIQILENIGKSLEGILESYGREDRAVEKLTEHIRKANERLNETLIEVNTLIAEIDEGTP